MNASQKPKPETTMKIFSVSYMATKNDNGHCMSYFTRQEAEEFRQWAIEAGYYHVSAIS